MKTTIYAALTILVMFAMAFGYETDTIETSMGPLGLTFVGHGTLMFEINNLVFHIDPVSREGDYSKLPAADVILITHEHGDHLDPDVIESISTEKTALLYTAACEKRSDLSGRVLKNGDTTTVHGVHVQAVPAYNLVHKRENGKPFHPKGNGNGYVLTFGDTRVYVAGDTENIPEMKALENIDVAFLPMNLPYTMDPEMVADAARAFKPRILYPYHYGRTDTQKLVELLEDAEDIEVRIRKM